MHMLVTDKGLVLQFCYIYQREHANTAALVIYVNIPLTHWQKQNTSRLNRLPFSFCEFHVSQCNLCSFFFFLRVLLSEFGVKRVVVFRVPKIPTVHKMLQRQA